MNRHSASNRSGMENVQLDITTLVPHNAFGESPTMLQCLMQRLKTAQSFKESNKKQHEREEKSANRLSASSAILDPSLRYLNSC